VKFKIDENLPAEAADILRCAGFAADTAGDEDLSGTDDAQLASASRSAGRVLVTLVRIPRDADQRSEVMSITIPK